MVFITLQEKTKKIFFIIVGLCVCVFVVQALFLVAMYTKSVNIRHEISQLRDRTLVLQSNNAKIKDALFAQFSRDSVTTFADSRGLVKEEHPVYLRTASQWVLASY